MVAAAVERGLRDHLFVVVVVVWLLSCARAGQGTEDVAAGVEVTATIISDHGASKDAAQQRISHPGACVVQYSRPVCVVG